MNKSQALNNFWNSFGIPAYDENSVQDKTPFPYITYSESLDSFENVITFTASIWDKNTSWKFVTDKQEEIAKRLGEYGHCIIKLDNGYLFLCKGTPFAQRMSGLGDNVKRIYLNLIGEFFTKY